MPHDLRPNFQAQRPVGLERAGRIAANEGVDQTHIQTRRGRNHFFQVLDHNAAMSGIGIERIGVVAETGDANAKLANQLADPARALVVELSDVNVRYASIAPVGTTRRPAHQLHAIETFVPGEGEDLLQTKVAEDGTLECPWHAALYDVGTGAMVRGPQGAFKPLAGVVKATTGAHALGTFPVEVRDGAIWLVG